MPLPLEAIPTGPVPAEILAAANRTYWTRGIVRPRSPDVLRIPILCDGKVVGFGTPHRAASGEARIDPVYVLPEYRGRGLVTAVYASIAGPMLACIEDGNTASERLHTAAGFVRVRRYGHGWYWRRSG